MNDQLQRFALNVFNVKSIVINHLSQPHLLTDQNSSSIELHLKTSLVKNLNPRIDSKVSPVMNNLVPVVFDQDFCINNFFFFF